ncbi:MAG TPA: 50S ribosomal protein L11 methyltransferase [Gaiellaceae bacterium]|nr:50S ribosomal protein L11 methyltransferase [Gaiellaceae bacterium]
MEEAIARLLDLHPEGFEAGEGELAVYTDAAGENRLREAFGEVSTQSVEPGWEERWREFHRPISIGPLWVGPPWEQPPGDATAVVVDPGRAFGTGSHPTTVLCLGFLLDLEPGSLLDVGCGSGVLSVAAAKLGFDPVVAIDRESAAVEAARRNAAANDVAIEVRHGDALATELPSTDVVLANIDLASVEALTARLDAVTLVTAGYFHSRMPRASGFAHRERRIDGGWAADLFERQ